MPLRIGVTGAFGFLGASTVAELLAQPLGVGQRIVAFGSTASSSPLYDASKVEFRRIDIVAGSGLAEEFKGLDILFHFAGKVGFSAREREAVWKVNVDGARNVFEAAVSAKVPRLVNVSSVSALGPAPEGGLLREGDRPYDDPPSPWTLASKEAALASARAGAWQDSDFLRSLRCVYLDSKLAALELALSMHASEGLPVVNILPGTAIGAGEAHEGIGSLLRMMAQGGISLVAAGSCSFMDSRDFARGARAAAMRGAPGEEYILAGSLEHNLTFRELWERVGTAAGKRSGAKAGRISACLAVPRGLSLAAAAVAELAAPRSGLSRGLVESGSVRAPCDCAKAISALGYDPSTPLSESIRLAIGA